ncbi:hypothetical protein NIES2101_02970 [Calothrix sp. HK-06]|nr:hypothetical protein NIES2101_02970 [Calothrix sp. HK-06]
MNFKNVQVLPEEFEIKGPGATVTCKNNALFSVQNHKLPASYNYAAELQFSNESLSLQFNDNEQVLEADKLPRNPVNSLIRDGRVLAESKPMRWNQVEGIIVSRTVQITHCDLSQVHISLKFQLKNDSKEKRSTKFKWQFILPSCVPFIYDQDNGNKSRCEQGELNRRQRLCGNLVFSLNKTQIDSVDNRLVILSFIKKIPRSIYLTKEENGEQSTTVSFSDTFAAGEIQEITIDLIYHVLLGSQVSNTVFLIARPDGQKAFWQGALAAAMSWVDRLETSRDQVLGNLGFRRFAPLLWFDNEKPLPDQILRFLHNMSSLQRIVVIGEVLHHDLENLLTALLDKGTNQQLCLQLFTCNEYYQDKVNALRGSIQARMIIANELSGRLHQLEKIISVSFVPNPDLLPLVVRQFMEEESARDFFAGEIHERDAFLVSSEFDEAEFLAATCVPMARHLAAPVLLWHSCTATDTLRYLEFHSVKRLFIVGRFSAADEAAIRSFCIQPKESTRKVLIKIERIPYHDPVTASSVISRLFKAHLLFDWLIQTCCAEREKRNNTELAINNITLNYVASIRDRKWAERLWSCIQAVVAEQKVAEQEVDEKVLEQLLLLYQEIFIRREEFVTSFKDYFTKLAEENEQLLDVLSPVWNDMVVLSDFTKDNNSNFNIFPAACLAAYHKAPLLFFPAIKEEEKEKFIEKRVQDFEYQFKNKKQQTRQAVAIEAYQNDIEEDPDLTSLVFPSDIIIAMQSLKPLTVALYSSDLNIPYECISDSNGPMFLKYAMAHLSGTDAYETSIITASGMLYAHDLQRQEKLRLLLCMANIPGLGKLKLEEERQEIYKALKGCVVPSMLKWFLNYALTIFASLQEENFFNFQCFYLYFLVKTILKNSSNWDAKQFDLKTLSRLEQINKKNLSKKLAEQVHIFHFCGHGYQDKKQPQRSGICLYNPEYKTNWESLNALEIKYHTKLGAHPIVFINACFPGNKGRVQLEDDGQLDTETVEETPEKSMTAETSEVIMGVSSSFIHIGAAAVMAPLWQIMDDTAILYAGYWYSYLKQGCSIGEAALLAKIDSIQDKKNQKYLDYRVLSYVIYGDPTLRLYPLEYLIKHHPGTAKRLLQLKRSS